MRTSAQQFGSNYNKLRAIIQAYLNTNKTWIVNDFRETDPMGRGSHRQEQRQRQRQQQEQEQKQQQKEQQKRQQRQGQEQRKEQGPQPNKRQKQNTAKAKAVENLTTTQSAACVERRVISHETAGHEPITTRR